MASLRTRLAGYFDEVKRRKVLQAAAGYAIVAWILLQVAEVTFEPLHFPDWSLTALVVLVIAGFPVAIALSWFFDLTIHGFIKDEGRDSAAADTAALEEIQRAGPSVAVLSFEDMSPERDQEYLCDGIAEEILNRLAQIENLRVASRTSSFRYKKRPDHVSRIGQELKVATVLEGSVRKAGDQLRITTQLINAADGYHIWSQSYDRKHEDIFEIQDEIATQVAEVLEVTLGTRAGDERYKTHNVRAYDYYLKGIHYFHRWGLTNVAYSIDMFAKAVEIDPQYAGAWAALADSYAMTCMYWSASEGNLAGTDYASLKALELAPDLAESHVSRGLHHFVHRDEPAAIAEFETALRLNPELFTAHYFYGRVRFQRGELKRAAELFETAEQLRVDDFQATILLRQAYHSLGKPAEARAAAERGVQRAQRHLELNPDDTRALNLGCAGLIEIGNKEQAMQWAERSLAIDNDNPDTLYNIACCYALAGEPELAFDCLERASLLRGMAIADWAQNDSDLSSLHEDPRFQALITRLKTQESPKEPGLQK